MTGQALDGVLTQAQRDSLEIVEFIFHIIDPTAEGRVIKLDEVQLQDKQRGFFLDRLRDIAEGTQYLFNAEIPNLRPQTIQLLENDDFIDTSYLVTQEFARLHRGQMSPGVFITSVVKYLSSPHNWKELVFLVKMDQQESFSYRYEDRDGRKVAIVDEVPNALNENKRAIQKSALIDCSDEFAWDVLAFDRVKKPELSDYFQDFLGVVERQYNSTLTKVAYRTVRSWASKIPAEQLPEGEDVNTYRGRAFNYLNDHDVFDTDGFVNAVVRDHDADRKEQASRALYTALAEAGVAGQQFRPSPDSLPKNEKKLTYKTYEGVTITFQGSPEAVGINIEKLSDGSSIVTIETHQLISKG